MDVDVDVDVDADADPTDELAMLAIRQRLDGVVRANVLIEAAVRAVLREVESASLVRLEPTRPAGADLPPAAGLPSPLLWSPYKRRTVR